MQTWGLIGIALALYGVLRLVFGPLPQDPWYPILADARRCGPIPRAGDVLTNLSILAAGLVAALVAAASGHNVKHVLAGMLLGCILAWLLLREPSSPSGNRP